MRIYDYSLRHSRLPVKWASAGRSRSYWLALQGTAMVLWHGDGGPLRPPVSVT